MQYANCEFMRKHAGMRPQDVPILLKILSYQKQSVNWQMRHLALDLGLSASEVSESLHRSYQAGLINQSKSAVSKNALLEFLEYGIQYVFPQMPGPLVRGIKTAHSAAPLNRLIQSEEAYVWPFAEGDTKGQAIIPLYPTLVEAAKKDAYLYQCLALIDALRVGRAREKQFAKKELRKLVS